MKTVIPIAVVLYESSTDDDLTQWLSGEVLRVGLARWLSEVRTVPVALPTSGTPDNSHALMVDAAMADLLACAAEVGKHTPLQNVTDVVDVVFLVLATFWDGQATTSKAAFAQLKRLAESDSDERKRLVTACEQAFAAQHQDRKGSVTVHVDVLIQALNAKKGEHTMRTNQSALTSSLEKKLCASPLMVGVTEGQVTAKGARHVDPQAGSDTAQKPNVDAPLEVDLTIPAVRAAVEKGQGECFFLLAAKDTAALAAQQAELSRSCEALSLACSPLFPTPRTVTVPGQSGASSTTVVALECLLRENIPGHHLELRLAMCGNVDSGKSTLTSVLTRGCHDNGRGYARAFVFNHKHEATTGRTSSISQNHLGFDAMGRVVNYDKPVVVETVASTESAEGPTAGKQEQSAGGADNVVPPHAHVGRAFTPQELSERSAKMVTLYDLAGHERYLKTTVLGMTRNMPDYACIVVSANNGIQRMTKEHLALCLALKLPFFVVITRIDSTPPNVQADTLANVHKLLKIPTVRKLPYPVRNEDEVIMAAKNLRHDRIAPIFEVSNVTGKGIAFITQFLNLLPLRKDWHAARALPREMIIDSTFFVTGVGTVVGGVVTQGVFRVNDTVLIGPDGFGHYRPVSIKSIHVKGVDSVKAEAGNDAALCLKKEKRSAIRKGNILADPAAPPKSYWQFEAEITILYHSTTITTNYEPVIHSTTVRQSARITYVAQENLRTGDRSIVRFHFLYRPEYMFEGQRLIFREGRTKGIGIVTKMDEVADETLLTKAKTKKQTAEDEQH